MGLARRFVNMPGRIVALAEGKVLVMKNPGGLAVVSQQ